MTLIPEVEAFEDEISIGIPRDETGVKAGEDRFDDLTADQGTVDTEVTEKPRVIN